MSKRDYKKGKIKSLKKDNYSDMFASLGQVCSVAFTYPDHLFELFQKASNFPRISRVDRIIYHYEGMY